MDSGNEVIREEILERLGGKGVKVIFFRAPAGYGKTVTAKQWLRKTSALPRFMCPVPERKDDLGSFSDRVKDALVLGTRIFWFDSLEKLVPEGFGIIQDLVERIDDGGQIILGSRDPFPFSLAPRLADGTALEIGPGELAFSPGEIVGLTSESIREKREELSQLIYRLSSGWPLATGLMTRIINETPQALNLLESIRMDTGKYLFEQRWHGFSEKAQAILGFCSKYNAIPGDSIRFLVPGQADRVMEELRSSLFLIEEGDKMIIHPLLKSQSFPLEEEEERFLQQNLFRWYRQRNDFAGALELDMARGGEHTDELLTEAALALEETSEIRKLSMMIKDVMAGGDFSSIPAHLFLAGAAITFGNLEEAGYHLAESLNDSDQNHDLHSRRRALLEANIALMEGNVGSALRIADDLSSSISAREPLRLASLYTALGVAAMWQKDASLKLSQSHFERAVRFSRTGKSVRMERSALLQAAIALRLAGRSDEAETRLCQLIGAMEPEGKNFDFLIVAYSEVAALYRERGERVKALTACEKAQMYLPYTDSLMADWWAGCELARNQLLSGEIEMARETLRNMNRDSAVHTVPPWFQSAATALEGEILIQENNQAGFIQWQRNHPLLRDYPGGLPMVYEYITEAYGRLSFGIETSSAWFAGREEFLAKLTEAGHELLSVRFKLIISALHYRWGERDKALSLMAAGLDSALCLHMTNSITMIRSVFSYSLDELVKIPGSSISVRTFLLNDRDKDPYKIEVGEKRELYIEELSSREKEVLQALAAGKTNEQLADQLFVSRNTIKTHLKHMYGKLSVSNRTQAVSRAREWGLL